MCLVKVVIFLFLHSWPVGALRRKELTFLETYDGVSGSVSLILSPLPGLQEERIPVLLTDYLSPEKSLTPCQARLGLVFLGSHNTFYVPLTGCVWPCLECSC